jgi:hypothetical protein
MGLGISKSLANANQELIPEVLIETPREKALRIINENKFKSSLVLNNLELTDEDVPEIPEYVNSLFLNHNKLTKIPKLHNQITALYLNHNSIEIIENLPSKVRYLDLSYNKIKKVPNLYNYVKLNNIEMRNNEITEIEEFPKYLETAHFNNNLIETLPKFPESLYEINLYNNKIKEIGKIPKNLGITLNKNPINKIKADTFSPNQIETRYFDEKEFTVLNLKKGTVLFRSSNGIDVGFKDMFVGYFKKDKYIISPEHESYFFLHPFNIGYGDNTIVYVLNNDVKLIMGIKPGKNYSKSDINVTFGQDCKTKKYKSQIKNIFNSKCLNDNFIDKHPDILGWIAPDGNKDFIKHNETYDILSSKGVGSYISYYENEEGLLTRPEITIYPFKKRSLVDIETKFEDFSVEKVYENMDSYNYRPILVIDDNRDIKIYKKIIDKLLSKKGYKDESGTYHMIRDEIDGTYKIKEYM